MWIDQSYKFVSTVVARTPSSGTSTVAAGIADNGVDIGIGESCTAVVAYVKYLHFWTVVVYSVAIG